MYHFYTSGLSCNGVPLFLSMANTGGISNTDRLTTKKGLSPRSWRLAVSWQEQFRIGPGRDNLTGLRLFVLVSQLIWCDSCVDGSRRLFTASKFEFSDSLPSNPWRMESAIAKTRDTGWPKEWALSLCDSHVACDGDCSNRCPGK